MSYYLYWHRKRNTISNRDDEDKLPYVSPFLEWNEQVRRSHMFKPFTVEKGLELNITFNVKPILDFVYKTNDWKFLNGKKG